MLAVSRFRSHSQGPISTSSKSFRSTTTCASGVPKMPKLFMCASPSSITSSPLVGRVARSAAITDAEPRKKVKGETAMRDMRRGTSAGSRPALPAIRRATGSSLRAGGFQSPIDARGAASRRARPSCSRSAGDSVGISRPSVRMSCG